jgi:hypothetical protein
MTAFARQNGPGAADTCPVEGAPIVLLPITVVIVTTPARALRQIVFEYVINNRDGIDYQRIIGRTDSQPDQLQKIPADDISGVVLAAAVGNFD